MPLSQEETRVIQSMDLTVLVQGAQCSGKTQLLSWASEGCAHNGYEATLDEEHLLKEEVCGHQILVNYVEIGGNPDYAECLDDWLPKVKACMLLINLEDRGSLAYFDDYGTTLSALSPFLGGVVVGNVPSGNEANRKISREEGVKFARALGKFEYVEINTRTGDNVQAARRTLMAAITQQVLPAHARTTPITSPHTPPRSTSPEALLPQSPPPSYLASSSSTTSPPPSSPGLKSSSPPPCFSKGKQTENGFLSVSPKEQALRIEELESQAEVSVSLITEHQSRITELESSRDTMQEMLVAMQKQMAEMSQQMAIMVKEGGVA